MHNGTGKVKYGAIQNLTNDTVLSRGAFRQWNPSEAFMDILVLWDHDTFPQDRTDGTTLSLGPKPTPDHHRCHANPILRSVSHANAEKRNSREYA